MTTTKFVVVRIDRDPSDTYAGDATRYGYQYSAPSRVAQLCHGQPDPEIAWIAFDLASDVAIVDTGSRVEYGVVEASDAGAARLMSPASWLTLCDHWPIWAVDRRFEG